MLEKILIILKNIEKQYVIDYLEKACYSVLRLPRYHCILNPIELTRNQLKCHVGHLNVCRSKPSNVVDLIQYICKENASTEIGIKEEEKFGIMDHILKPFMTEAVIIWKPVHRFPPQINGLVSI